MRKIICVTIQPYICERISMTFYYDSNNSAASVCLSRNLACILKKRRKKNQTTIIMCIGSDRSTGDCLGPLIGYKLNCYSFKNVFIYGTLLNPIHACNLEAALRTIKHLYSNPFIIAIDASLGIKEHVGYITLSDSPLKPGLGLKKKLPEVGDIHITGIVNYSSSKNTLLLQTTHLSTVMQLADIICLSLTNCLCDSLISVLPCRN